MKLFMYLNLDSLCAVTFSNIFSVKKHSLEEIHFGGKSVVSWCDTGHLWILGE